MTNKFRIYFKKKKKKYKTFSVVVSNLKDEDPS